MGDAIEADEWFVALIADTVTVGRLRRERRAASGVSNELARRRARQCSARVRDALDAWLKEVTAERREPAKTPPALGRLS